ncbi:MAG: hypothetical protein JJT94_13150 [Bernardetiaceae bacterium]|nr:hypothetical protein [Bernardetiaceae bacterium]
MMKVLHYDKKHCKIYYLPKENCVYLHWQGFAGSDNFREACNYSLRLLIDKQADKMIADNSEAKVVGEADMQWMQEEWFPKAFTAGFRSSAVVVAKDIFRDIATKRIVNELDKSKFTVQYFQDFDHAYEWVKSLEDFKQQNKNEEA